jgi:hypothetical protein
MRRPRPRAVEFPDRQAYRRRQRQGTMTAVYGIGIALLVWGGYHGYRHYERAQQRAMTVPAPPKKPPPPAPKPAPPPPDPVVTRTARMAAIRDAMQRDDEVAMQQQIDALQDDFRKFMRFAAPDRIAAYETARTEAWKVAGVRSLAWLDRINLYVVVDSPEHRTDATIDALCKSVTAMGDKPDVVIDLQVDYRKHEEVDLLSRNCRTPSAEQSEAAAKQAEEARAAERKAEAERPPGQKADAADKDPVREDSLRILKDTTPEM